MFSCQIVSLSACLIRFNNSPGNNKTGKANVQSVISLTKNTDLGYSFKEKSWTKKDMLNMKSFPRIRRLEGNQDLYPGSSAFNSFSRKTSCGAFLSTLYNFPIVHRAAHAVEPFLLYILLFLFNFTPFAFFYFSIVHRTEPAHLYTLCQMTICPPN